DAARLVMREERHDALFRHLLHQQREILGAIGDHADVGAVALVAGPAVGEISQLHETHSKPAAIALRGTKQESVSSRERTDVRTPPPPAGPHVYSAFTSRPRLSAVSRSAREAATRRRTSRTSVGACRARNVPASSAKRLTAPMRSTRSSRPSRRRRSTS